MKTIKVLLVVLCVFLMCILFNLKKGINEFKTSGTLDISFNINNNNYTGIVKYQNKNNYYDIECLINNKLVFARILDNTIKLYINSKDLNMDDNTWIYYVLDTSTNPISLYFNGKDRLNLSFYNKSINIKTKFKNMGNTIVEIPDEVKDSKTELFEYFINNDILDFNINNYIKNVYF